MTVYVDALIHRGWVLRGRKTRSCHMFVGVDDSLEDLHAMAERIGLKLSWFQSDPKLPHYDLTETRRIHAITLGAVETSRWRVVEVIRERRRRGLGGGS